MQAVARVNRVFEGKDQGLVIDYRGIFGEMNEALELYAALEREGFEASDIVGALTDVGEEIAKLPTRHASVWEVFHGVENKRDPEAMQRWLEPKDRRDTFYDALTAFAKTLQLALSNPAFQERTPDATKARYTGDLKYFANLRVAVKQRYAESVDYSVYEAQLRNIVARHVGDKEVKVLIEPVSIFSVDRFEEEVAQLEGDAAKADAIAARVTKTLTEKMDEDPTLYKKLSELIREAIDAHRAKRLSDAEYLKRMWEHLATARNGSSAGVPEPLRTRDEARAYYGVLKEGVADHAGDSELLADVALKIESIIVGHKVRDWQHNKDAQNRMHNDIDDLFYDLKKDTGVFIPYDVLDEVMGKILNIAKVRDA